jgi:N-acetylglucosaminyldiphosphoundecaprenol N-acetyl-beta-D-mannosaminyltransferase
MSRVNILGLPIDNCTMHEALQKIVGYVEGHQFSFAATPNVDFVIKARKDPVLRDLYEKANLVVADGVPLLWASRMLGTPLQERINGTDLFERTCELAAERGYSVYLLGGNPGAARNACKKLVARLPELRIAGWECPPYGFGGDVDENLKVQARIRESGAQILFLGFGTPKQEKWISAYGREAGISFAVGVGISFSFVGGEIKRAPRWMQHGGLEWLWRLLKEPKRLWKRYLVEDIPFFYLLLVAFAKTRAARLARSTQHAIPPEQTGT